MEIKVTQTVTDDEVINLLDMMSRASGYWCKFIGDLAYEKTTTDFMHNGLKLELQDFENPKARYTLELKDIQRGFEVMADKFPKHFANVITGDTDGDTADVLLQCALFGDIIYG